MQFLNCVGIDFIVHDGSKRTNFQGPTFDQLDELTASAHLRQIVQSLTPVHQLLKAQSGM